ncbi:MAG: hypothetical protein P9L89_00015, partial [Candidatus Celaenobacter polaris]|nr:hypothetical protein [Candidatus Celaenobacter polaris]
IVKSTVTLRFSKCEVGQTLLRQLADQGDNSKDRYKLTVFLKVIFRKHFIHALSRESSSNFWGYPCFKIVLKINFNMKKY